MTQLNPLIIFALKQEARGLFDDHSVLYTGVGKVNAAYALMHYLSKNPAPELIINLGSAGSAVFNASEIVQCTKFIQRDMDVTPLGFAPYQTPLSDIPPILEIESPQTDYPQAICGTGDHFDTAHTGEAYTIVDMEAYALAHIAHKQNIPFLCLKYISDGADGNAHLEWEAALDAGAKALKSALDKYIDLL